MDHLTLTEGAIVLHELFTCYVAAGFSEDQAMTLLCVLLAARAGGAL